MGLFLDAVAMLQHAVDAVKDIDHVIGRTDVDVGGHFADTIHHDQFHQFGNDGAGNNANGLSQGSNNIRHALFDRMGHEEIGFFDGFLVEIAVNDENRRSFAGQFGNRIHGNDVAGIGNPDGKPTINNRQGDQTGFLGHIL